MRQKQSRNMQKEIEKDTENTANCKQIIADLKVGYLFSFKMRLPVNLLKFSIENKRLQKKYSKIELKILFRNDNFFTGIDEKGTKYTYNLSDFVCKRVILV